MSRLGGLGASVYGSSVGPALGNVRQAFADFTANQRWQEEMEERRRQQKKAEEEQKKAEKKGQSGKTGGGVTGALTGAGVGFLTGGPVGAVVGGVAGGVGGYQSGSIGGGALAGGVSGLGAGLGSAAGAASAGAANLAPLASQTAIGTATTAGGLAPGLAQTATQAPQALANTPMSLGAPPSALPPFQATPGLAGTSGPGLRGPVSDDASPSVGMVDQYFDAGGNALPVSASADPNLPTKQPGFGAQLGNAGRWKGAALGGLFPGAMAQQQMYGMSPGFRLKQDWNNARIGLSDARKNRVETLLPGEVAELGASAKRYGALAGRYGEEAETTRATRQGDVAYRAGQARERETAADENIANRKTLDARRVPQVIGDYAGAARSFFGGQASQAQADRTRATAGYEAEAAPFKQREQVAGALTAEGRQGPTIAKAESDAKTSAVNARIAEKTEAFQIRKSESGAINAEQGEWLSPEEMDVAGVSVQQQLEGVEDQGQIDQVLDEFFSRMPLDPIDRRHLEADFAGPPLNYTPRDRRKSLSLMDLYGGL